LLVAGLVVVTFPLLLLRVMGTLAAAVVQGVIGQAQARLAAEPLLNLL
jgi:hypothetical protein